MILKSLCLILITLLTIPSVSEAHLGSSVDCTRQNEDEYMDFTNPERVTISDYDGEVMEAFISRDGEYLFFNNRNDPTVNTDLHYARYIDDVTFEYLGEVEGVNTDALDAVPSMDLDNNFYFVSTRSYEETYSTIYQGQFDDGEITSIELVAGISREELPIVNYDVEISPDGNTLYFVDAEFSSGGTPITADMVIAVRDEVGFVRLPNSDEILANLNTPVLEYAVGISEDGLELFFTRADIDDPDSFPQIYRAERPAVDEPFACPQRIHAIEGFVEAATLLPDELSLYYHQLNLETNRFELYRVSRQS